MRVGGLIFKFQAAIYRLDPVAVAAVDPDGAGPATTGYDEDFQEPRLEVAEGETAAKPIRRELDPIRIPCQVEPDAWDVMRMFDSGDSPRTAVPITVHFDDLKRLGLLDNTGAPTLRKGDRLGAIYDKQGLLVQTIKDPPGLYLAMLQQDSFGLSLRRPKRQLLILGFKDRQQAMGVEA